MLSIGQLASYAGVTVRTVRHYHQIGLLPEPERDHSGYRSYDTAAVVRLIRIRVLADAGVPLARVQELLVADSEEFARAVGEIDKALNADIRRLQASRKRIAKLAAGDHLALPQVVLDYLDRLRGVGVGEAYIELERDAWIMLAAQDPLSIDAVIAEKNRHLDEDPDMTRLYRLLGSAPEWLPGDPRVVELADLVEHLRIRAVQSGELEIGNADQTEPLTALLDAAMTESAPVARELLAILEQRGWRGWNRLERIPEGRIPPIAESSPPDLISTTNHESATPLEEA
ncbi:MerR family transcriptional regulator [Microbacterium sp. DT81.1]|uniref:helix-turn-helix domain-containing protein n=1 Tax=Microbacterium sp. DT81.1 TaxID=3393413 RepID=UPI003CF213AC